MPTVRICIYGMRNADDEARVEHALAREPGVFRALADCSQARVDVDYEDDEVALAHLIEVVEAEGFRAALGG